MRESEPHNSTPLSPVGQEGKEVNWMADELPVHYRGGVGKSDLSELVGGYMFIKVAPPNPPSPTRGEGGLRLGSREPQVHNRSSAMTQELWHLSPKNLGPPNFCVTKLKMKAFQFDTTPLKICSKITTIWYVYR